MYKRKVLWFVGFLALFFCVVVGGWYVSPVHSLDIVVLDKSAQPELKTKNIGEEIIANRKHYGLFWMLEQLRYRKPDNSRYNFKTDYFLSTVHQETGQKDGESFARLSRTPDILYISDIYGDENNRGLNYEDIATAAVAHVNGATLIAEADLFSFKMEEGVRSEIESTFGISYLGWTGRCFRDLGDLDDVPDWALSLHETQYGRRWDYSGEGLLLVSDSGELVILEKEKDFNGSMVTISLKSEYKNEFKCRSQRFYNWFVIVSSEFETQTVAEFYLDLNQPGQEKFKRVSNKTSFPAVVRTQGNLSPAYFFAGEFTDYTGPKRYPNFLFSYKFYQFFSYEKPGDATSFYWNFYYPLMKTILKKAEANKKNVVQPGTNNEEASRLAGNAIEVKFGNEWKPFTVKGFNINAVMPGAGKYEYTRDISVYSRFLSEISAMGGNCVRVYDLLPPEFYRALYQHNRKYPDSAIYFFQSVTMPGNIASPYALSESSRSEIRRNIEYIVDAVHGKGSIPAVGARKGGTYIQDVSPYLLGFIVETDTTRATVSALRSSNPGYKYQGEYVSSESGAAEGLIALACDYVFSYSEKTYGYKPVVGAAGNPALAPSLPWSGNISLDLNSLVASEQAKPHFFLAYQLYPFDEPVANDRGRYSGYTDENGSLPFGGYLSTFMKTQTRYPVLIDGFGVATNINAFEGDSSVNGYTETGQGETLVRMLKAIQKEGCIGGLISDYNDNWYQSSGDLADFVLPGGSSRIWKNALDPKQNMGVTAVEPVGDGETGMSIQDRGRMREIQIRHDPAFIYISLMLDKDIDFDNEQLFIGLDTYQRNDGEYRYDPAYFANSLSGMEYIIKFESKNSAALYVTPSYNRSRGQFMSKESYTGRFDFIYQFAYGSFDSSGNTFYQAGSSVHIRIPWNLLNFTNPSRHMVINDSRPLGSSKMDEFGLRTVRTDGIIISVLIADKSTKDTLYIFPESKQSAGYKSFKWNDWDDVDFAFRQKDSCKILSNFFNSLK